MRVQVSPTAQAERNCQIHLARFGGHVGAGRVQFPRSKKVRAKCVITAPRRKGQRALVRLASLGD